MTMIKTNRKRRFKGTLVLDYGDLVGAVMGLQYIFRRYDENYTTPKKMGITKLHRESRRLKPRGLGENERSTVTARRLC